MTTKYKKTGEPFDVFEAYRRLYAYEIIISEDEVVTYHVNRLNDRIVETSMEDRERNDFFFLLPKKYNYYEAEEIKEDNDHPLLVEAIKNREAVKIRAYNQYDQIREFLFYHCPFDGYCLRPKADLFIITHTDHRKIINLAEYENNTKEYDFANKRFVEEERRLTMQKLDEFEQFIKDVDKPKLTPEMLTATQEELEASFKSFKAKLKKINEVIKILEGKEQ